MSSKFTASVLNPPWTQLINPILKLKIHRTEQFTHKSSFSHTLIYTLNAIFHGLILFREWHLSLSTGLSQKVQSLRLFLTIPNSQTKGKFLQHYLQSILNPSAHHHFPFKQPLCLTWTAAIVPLDSLLPLLFLCSTFFTQWSHGVTWHDVRNGLSLSQFHWNIKSALFSIYI